MNSKHPPISDSKRQSPPSARTHTAVTRNSVRQLLEDALPTSADFDAFFIDHFTSIYGQFSAGMTQTEKLNVLLKNNHIQLADIVKCLGIQYPEEVRAWKVRQEVDIQHIRPHIDPLENMTPSKKAIIILSCACGLLLILPGWIIFHGYRLPRSSSQETVIMPLHGPTILSSEPDGAEVIVGQRAQGHTPFKLDSLPSDITTLCLRARYYEDMVIHLEQQQGRFISKNVQMIRRINSGNEETFAECRIFDLVTP